MFGVMRGRKPRKQFEDFKATELYCNKCKGPKPVREQVALYLAHETLFHYTCVTCGEVLGKKTGPAV